MPEDDTLMIVTTVSLIINILQVEKSHTVPEMVCKDYPEEECHTKYDKKCHTEYDEKCWLEYDTYVY